MLNAFRDNVWLSRLESDIPLLRLNRQDAIQTRKKVICVIMGMPNELTLNFYHHHILAVELGNDFR